MYTNTFIGRKNLVGPAAIRKAVSWDDLVFYYTYLQRDNTNTFQRLENMFPSSCRNTTMKNWGRELTEEELSQYIFIEKSLIEDD